MGKSEKEIAVKFARHLIEMPNRLLESKSIPDHYDEFIDSHSPKSSNFIRPICNVDESCGLKDELDSHSLTEPTISKKVRTKFDIVATSLNVSLPTCTYKPVCAEITHTEFDTLQEGDYVLNLSKENFEKILDIEGESDDVRFEWEEGLGLAYHMNVLVDTDYQPNHQTTQLTALEFLRRAENTFKK